MQNGPVGFVGQVEVIVWVLHKTRDQADLGQVLSGISGRAGYGIQGRCLSGLHGKATLTGIQLGKHQNTQRLPTSKVTTSIHDQTISASQRLLLKSASRIAPCDVCCAGMGVIRKFGELRFSLMHTWG